MSPEHDTSRLRNTLRITIPFTPEVNGAQANLSDEALAFIEKLHAKFAGTRNELLEAL